MLGKLHNKIIYTKKWFHRYFSWKRVEFYFVSFPKTGRTWMRVLMALYYTKKYGVPVSDKFNTFRKVHAMVPTIFFEHRGLHGGVLNKAKKAHVPLDLIKEKNLDDLQGKSIVFLVRDPRDTVVSHYHSVNKRADIKGPLVQEARKLTFSEFIRHEKLGMPLIVEYMNLWYEYKENFETFHLVRYEDAREAPENTFKRLLEFFGEEVDETILKEVIEETRFEKMQKREKEVGSADPRLRPTDTNDPNSFKARKGKVGGYVEEASEEDITYMNEMMKKLHPDFRYV